MKLRSHSHLPAVLAALILITVQVSKADLIIDPFSSYQSLTTAGPPSGVKNTFGALTDPIVLGGERDIWVERTSANSGSVAVDVNGSISGALSFNSSSATAGYTVISYDGTDGSSGINYTGLGGVDITQSGVNTGLAIGTTSDIGASAFFTVYTDATHYSTYDVPVNADTNFDFTRYFADFNSFTAAGSGGGADFSNVGAITLTIDGQANPGADVTVDYFVATVPEPSAPMLVLATGAFLIIRRPHARRRSV